MFTDPLMSIIDAGATMFLDYIERVSRVTSYSPMHVYMFVYMYSIHCIHACALDTIC